MRGRSGGFVGTVPLVRLALRRDRVRLPVWLGVIVALVLGTVATFEDLYPTEESRQARAELLENPTFRLFTGPYGFEDYTFGPMATAELGMFTLALTAVMVILAVVRHTRDEEESGRAELLRAGVLGRYAQPTAAMIVALGASVAAGILVTLSLLVLPDEPFSGAALMGIATTGTGAVFAGVGLVASQVSDNTRSATGVASLALAVTYVVGAVGYMADVSFLVWVSPVNWGVEMRPYVDDRVWPVVLMLVATVACVSAARWLGVHRDVGAGMLSQRPGHAEGGGLLGSSLGLALRLQRVSLLVWVLVLFSFGLLYGSIIENMVEFAEESEAVEEFFVREGAGGVAESGMSTIAYFLALATGGFAVAATLVARREEQGDRVEPLLASAVHRSAWAGSHLLVALAGVVLLLAAAGLGMGTGWAIAEGDADRVGQMLGAALNYAPAAWVFAGLAVALFGLIPRFTGVAWGVFGIMVFMGMLGPLFDLPEWVYDLVPFDHVPQMPAAGFGAVPFVGLGLSAAVLVAAGLVGFRRRDVSAA